MNKRKFLAGLEKPVFLSNFIRFLVAICAYLWYNKYMEVLPVKLTCAGTKKSPTYYIQKTIRIGNKTTTKTVERLGNIEEIKARCGDQDPIEWAKEYAKNLLSQKKKLRRNNSV